MSGIRRVSSITFEIDPVMVWGRRPGFLAEQFTAERVVVLMQRDQPGKVAAFQFEGPRWVKSRGAWSERPARFSSEDLLLNEVKLAARRIVSAAAHKTSGDPAGRRAS